MDESAESSRLTFSQTVAGFELVISYRKMIMAGSETSIDQERNENLIDTRALLELANERIFLEHLSNEANEVSTYELSCLYWIYHALGSHWNPEIVNLLEDILCNNITKELLL